MAEWTTENVRDIITGPDETGRMGLRGEKFDRWLAEVKAEEQRRILGGLLRLPITRTQAWDRGWYSVSITDAVSVVRGEQ